MKLSRREFLARSAASAALATLPAAITDGEDAPAARPTIAPMARRPNVLYILMEDIGPQLGCYGEPLVRTPNVDALARDGVRFQHAFCTAPVCSASRSALMTGCHQIYTGTHQHRTWDWNKRSLPSPVRHMTDWFRMAGYFTCNLRPPGVNSTNGGGKLHGAAGSGKVDLNFVITQPHADDPFDGSDWSQRAAGQPFFAHITIIETHKGEGWKLARSRPKAELVNPEQVTLPPYFPDHPVARDEYANYLDAISLADGYVGQLLARLRADGLDENTIVVLSSDHGALFRGKQFLYDGGLHIPLIVRCPGGHGAGTVDGRLVSGVDLAPTMLRFAGVTLPEGATHGIDLFAADRPVQDCIFASRDRMDDSIDRMRALRTSRYKYIRNYLPAVPYMQRNRYKERNYPTWNLVKQLHRDGRLTGAADAFAAATKPIEELYDLEADPHEINNLAANPENVAILKDLRGRLDAWLKVTDKGRTYEDPIDIHHGQWRHLPGDPAPAGTLALAGTAAAGSVSTGATQGKRQAVLFVLDTQGANCVGCYRPDLALGTPAVDALASRGVRFEHAYTCSPVCGPARSAIFTGLFPHSNGVLGNDMAPHLDLPTMGQRLRDAGFATGYVGKWHLDGSDYFGDGRCPRGWDPAFWFDGRNYLDSLPTEEARALSRHVLKPGEARAKGVAGDFTHAWRVADRARAFIHQHRDEDFLLVVSIDEPHHPHICPEPFASAFEDFRFPVPNADDPLMNKPRAQREWAEFARAHRAKFERSNGITTLRHPVYFGCNSFADSQVGRVLAAIDAEVPDALVIHTSDHGDMFGSHGLQGKGPSVYQEQLRVPLIVRWPDHAPAGVVSGGAVSHIDLLPTILDYFGVTVPDLLQGKSLLAQIRDPAQRTNGSVFAEFNRFEIDHDGFGAFAPIRAVFDGQFKLALNLLDEDEFYDLRDDPLELHNRIREQGTADIRDRLHAELEAWMNRTRDPFRGPHWLRRPWSLRDHSTWGGPTRPRPFDPDYFPRTLLYDTGRAIDQYEYPKDT